MLTSRTFHSWLRPRPISRKPSRLLRTGLRLQYLEERAVPALLTVTDSGDTGANTLRGIIGTANTNGEADTIQFSGVTTVTLTSGQITVSEAQGLLIDGGAGVTINSTAASAATSRIFTITATGKPAIGFSNLTLSGGKLSTGVGGAVLFTDQPVTLTNCTVTNNTASAGAGGAFGTVTAAANLTINNSTFSSNSASGTGGAISMGGTSTVTINNSTFSKNSATSNGGGLAMVGVGVATITFTNFDLNVSAASGGGVHGASTVTLTIADCVFQNNKSLTGGALRTAGTIVTMTLDRTLVTGNTATSTLGGGFYMGNGGTVTINNCTFSNNTANTSGGGLRLSTHTSLIQNSTFSGNVSNATTSTTGGGGIVVTGAGNHTINNSTITNNSVPNATAKGGGWFSTVSTGTITFNSTIVAGNSNANQSDISSGGTLPRNIAGNDNLVGALDTAVITLTGTNDPLLLGTQATPVDAKLVGLASNGGPTPTHALAAGSPAFDKGNNAAALTFDQRGTGFPRTNGTKTDVGSFEGVSTDPSASASLADVTTAGGTTYTAIVDYADETGINTGGIDVNDVTLSGPGFGPVSPTMASSTGGGMAVQATYTFPVPGGAWDYLDNGTYTLTMVASQVFDTDGPTAVAAGTIDTFKVGIAPPPLVVDSSSDIVDGNYSAGQFTLREAIGITNAAAGTQDSISFDASLTGLTITLGTEISITDSVIITGLGAANLTLAGGGSNRLFNINVAGSVGNIEFKQLTLTGGNVAGTGGAILTADETLTFSKVVVTSNVSSSNGGAVNATGPTVLNISDSTFSLNNATGTGGALNLAGASTITITNSEFKINVATSSGGAIQLFGAASITINKAVFDTNTGTTGGAIQGSSTVVMNATDSTFSNNNGTSGGALRFASIAATSITLDRCIVSGNVGTGLGGGIYMSTSGNLTISNSTFNNNTGAGGGAIRVSSVVLTITNSTLSGNTSTGTAATTGGGAILNASTPNVTIRNTTITKNDSPDPTSKGGGVFISSAIGTVTLNSVILADNTNPNQRDISASALRPVAGDNNLIGAVDPTLITLTGSNNGALIGTEITPVDPVLDVLAANGGTTQTHALKVGSPAFNKGNNNAALTFDQRGTGFARTNGSKTDVGAFEGVSTDPSASANLPDVTTVGGTTYTAIVDYSDETAINTGNIDVNDVTLSGPGFGPVSPTSASFTGGGMNVQATYTFPVPGGAWDFGDNGIYTVTMVANEVFDTDGPNAVPAGPIDAFNVAIPLTLVVDNGGDIEDGNYTAGEQTLREAINRSNAAAGTQDLISFAAALNGTTITLTGELPITGALIITGPGATNLAVSGNPSVRIFGISITGVGGDVSIAGLTLSNGNATTGTGGAISVVDESVTLNGMVFSGNTITGTGAAIGVTGAATLNITNSTFIGNSASSSGGAINLATAATVTLNNAVFDGNTGTTGGAIQGSSTVVMNATDSTFKNNKGTSGGALRFASVVATSITLNRCVVSGNTGSGLGGGIYMSTSGNLTVTDSTFSNNTGAGGGAIRVSSVILTITNSTLSGNTSTGTAATTGGGAILNASTPNIIIQNSTITKNVSANATSKGGGLFISSAIGTVTLSSTIVADNTNPNQRDISASALRDVAGNNNLIGARDPAIINLTGTNDPGLVGTEGSPVSPSLAPLGNYGGPTQTHALLPGSLALDKGNNSATLSFDQRGTGFPRVVNGTADVGSTEGEIKVPIASANLVDVTTSGGTVYIATVIYTDETGINTGSIDVNDVTLGGGGFGSPVAPFDASFTGGGTSVTATYKFTPPGGSWDFGDNGSYTLTMVANEVFDTDGPNPASAGPIDSFNAAIPLTLVVDNGGDIDDGIYTAGQQTLREAVNRSNAAAGTQDLISFAAALNGTTITLTSEMPITGALTITGPGATNLAVSGNGSVRIFGINVTGVGGDVSMAGLTLTGGKATTGTGAAISVVDELVTLNGMVFSGNTITGTGAAIGVTGAATLNITNSTFSGNSASSTGGAINLATATTVTLNNAVFDANTSSSTGGAIQATSSVVMNATASTFKDNKGTNGGALRFASNAATSITLNRCSVTGNSGSGLGGGIYMSTAGNLTIIDSTFSNNTGAGGGAIRVNGVTTIITNSTLSGNTSTGTGATTGGGAFLNAGTPNITIQSSTITKNVSANATSKGGGLFISSAIGTVTLSSTIVADNTNPNQRDISASGLRDVAGSNNLIGARDSAIINLTGTNDPALVGTEGAPVSASLAPLGNYGGPTQTHALLPGSLALDKGNNTATLSFDQRGTGFPRVVNGTADVGSTEGEFKSPFASANLADVTTAGGTEYVATVIYTDETGINTGSIDVNDVTLGGGGFGTPVAPFSASFTGGGTSVTATYKFTPPGGSWDIPDNGTYTLTQIANQVFDTDGPNPAFPGTIDSFKVAIGTTYLVDELGDVDDGNYTGGELTLREAIKLSNASVGTTDTITFDTALNGMPILIASGELAGTDAFVLIGNGAANTILSGNSTNRLFNLTHTGQTSTMSLVTITAGLSTGSGGAILMNSSSLTLSNVIVSNNATPAGAFLGGAINLGAATLKVFDSQFTGNSAGTTGGGAIGTGTGTIEVTRTTFDGNLSAGSAGAIFVNGAGSLTIVDSTISNNIASGTTGGAINTTTGTITITNSTISGNIADNASAVGGGIRITSTGKLTVHNSTITGNVANTGGGIAFTGTLGTVTIHSTIVAANSSAVGGPDIHSTNPLTLAGGFNLIGVADLGNFTPTGTDQTGTSSTPLDPLLDLLGSNGGTTKTHALLGGSPAFNAGSNVLALANDQRGSGFPRVLQSIPDVGSFEGVNVTPAAKATAPNVPPINPTQKVSVVYTDETGINTGGVGLANVRLTGPGYGSPEAPTAFTITAGSNGDKSVTVEYTFTPPGGTWDILDNGKYTVEMQANQVFDTDGPNPVNAGPKGSFTVGVPNVYEVDEISDLEDGLTGTGQMSIREAITLANNDANPSVINFSNTVFAAPQIIVMGFLQLNINEAVTINGPAAGVTLNANAADRLVNTTAAPTGAVIVMSNMTFTNGLRGASTITATMDRGGAILISDENVTLNNCVVSNSSSGVQGGGIHVDIAAGQLTLNDCLVTGNTVTGADSIAFVGDGGGISIGQGGPNTNVVINRSTLSGNSAAGNGGGIYFANNASVIFNDTTISGNTAGGTAGGGGVYFFGTVGTNGFKITNCTISGNNATGGPGGGVAIWFNLVGGLAEIRNSTITGNNSSLRGGGLDRYFGSATGTISLSSTIVANNTVGGVGTAPTADIGASAASTISGNNNLIGINDPATNTTFSGTNPLIGTTGSPINAMLDPLALNGAPAGRPLTHALQAGSPALNAGNNLAAVAFDQRGTGFNRTSGAGTDIGAFEVQVVSATVTGVSINSKLLTPVDKAQRSYVRDVAITFDSIITFTGTPESAFTLDKIGGGSVTLAATVDNSGPGTVVTLTFTGGSVNATSLADGRYALHVLSAGITGGLGGGDFIFDEPAPPTALDTSKIFRIFGDYTGDGNVAANDFIQFRLALGNSSPPFQLFDFENDGAVAASDFIQFRLRFGGSI